MGIVVGLENLDLAIFVEFLTNQRISERAACSGLVSIVDDSGHGHKGMKDAILLDKLGSNLDPKRDEIYLKCVEVFYHGLLSNQIWTPPNRMAVDYVVSKHVEISIPDGKAPLGDRIPELVKEFKVLLGSNLRGDTSREREEAEDQGGDFHCCGLRENSSVLWERGVNTKDLGFSVSSRQVAVNRLGKHDLRAWKTRLAKPPYSDEANGSFSDLDKLQ